tara:strand:+ start:3645 stop:5363 length:1719 start_codon:yes stop_codon:yes gene_type:complete
MLNEFFILVFYYFLILISIFGFGLLSLNFISLKNRDINLGYAGLSGLFFILIYSYISNIFYPHNILHNSIFLVCGLFFFLYFFRKKIFQLKNQIYLSIVVFLILLISLFIFKNHDDFAYYHFPYTYYLTQDSLHLGVGQFNHGFRTPSSIFYINSLFYLPFGDYYLFNFTSIYFLGFANLFLLQKIYNFDFTGKTNIQIKKINFINYLSLLSLIFINIFFYRISEHGTDRSAQILILLFVIVILENLNLKKNNRIDFQFIYILMGLIISLKSFYILYTIFLIPILYFMYEKNSKFLSNLQYLIFNKYFIYLFIVIFFTIFTYLINTGCLIYPLSFSCFDNLSWSIMKSDVKLMNNWYELWSKAGATPNYRVENPDVYIQYFNWVQNWINNYFFNKFSDFFFGIIFLSLVFVAVFFNKNKKKKKIILNKYTLIIYIILFILSLEWFYNHPALRYGGYSLFALLIFIPLSIYVESFRVSEKKFKLSCVILILITLSIFLGRNINRIIYEVNKYDYKPFSESFYKVDETHFRIQIQIDNKINNFQECELNEKECKNYKKIIDKKYGKIIFLRKND